MTTDELRAIRERCEAATPGPWVKNIGRGGVVTPQRTLNGIPDRDSFFIAHARADIPALLAEVERLRTLLRETLFLAESPCGPGLDAVACRLRNVLEDEQ